MFESPYPDQVMQNFPIYILAATPALMAVMLASYLAVLVLWDKITTRIELKRVIKIGSSVNCGYHKAPFGWYCTRQTGHDGPCAAVPALYEKD